jgi:succinate dehydrogenase / fumarate reductase membrane anchor subunit
MSRHMAGLRAWLWQRLTAIYMAVYLLIIMIALSVAAPHDFQAWHASVASPWVALPTLLFFAALLLHAWVGIRDVIIDYIRSAALRLLALGLVGVALLGCGFWVTEILLMVMQ